MLLEGFLQLRLPLIVTIIVCGATARKIDKFEKYIGLSSSSTSSRIHAWNNLGQH